MYELLVAQHKAAVAVKPQQLVDFPANVSPGAFPLGINIDDHLQLRIFAPTLKEKLLRQVIVPALTHTIHKAETTVGTKCPPNATLDCDCLEIVSAESGKADGEHRGGSRQHRLVGTKTQSTKLVTSERTRLTRESIKITGRRDRKQLKVARGIPAKDRRVVEDKDQVEPTTQGTARNDRLGLETTVVGTHSRLVGEGRVRAEWTHPQVQQKQVHLNHIIINYQSNILKLKSLF